MLVDRFTLAKCLELLEIPILDFENYTIEDLKRQYHVLVKKYHPDLNDGFVSSAKMASINNAMDIINEMIENGSIKLKKSNQSNNQKYEEEKNRSTKENTEIRSLYNRLDKLSSKVHARKKQLIYNNQIMIIGESLEYYREILEKIKIVSNTSSIYDYGIILNYVELFEYFYSKTLHITDNSYTFDFNHSNHIKSCDDTIEILKDKICLVHKQLLCNEIKKIIKSFSESKIYDKKIIKEIENINKEIINLKWYLCLNEFDFNQFDRRVKELIKHRYTKEKV